MLEELFLALCRVPGLKKQLWRGWYSYLARTQPASDWTFMNYGYAGPEMESLQLDAADEPDRNGIQLYRHIAGAVDLEDCTALEVGSGRGGGTAFVSRYLRPGRMIGIDLSNSAVELCRNRHRAPGLEFQVGDAENLPFAGQTFDAVVNVESSHCYPSFDRFLQEVRRVLRPGGHFLYADFRNRSSLDSWRQCLTDSGLALLRETDITPCVVAALELDDASKLALIDRLIPKPLRASFLDFAAVKGSSTFEAFASGTLVYKSFVLRK